MLGLLQNFVRFSVSDHSLWNGRFSGYQMLISLLQVALYPGIFFLQMPLYHKYFQMREVLSDSDCCFESCKLLKILQRALYSELISWESPKLLQIPECKSVSYNLRCATTLPMPSCWPTNIEFRRQVQLCNIDWLLETGPIGYLWSGISTSN